MTLTKAQEGALEHLRSAYAGPEAGTMEVVLNPPHRQYAVGMLFPSESTSSEERQVADDLDVEADVQRGDVEEEGASVPLAEDWRPSSVAISFITDRPNVTWALSGGTYKRVDGDGPPRWARSPFSFSGLELSTSEKMHQLVAGDVPIEVGSRWRRYGSAYLVTVHVRALSRTTGDERLDVPLMLFQVALIVRPSESGSILEYDTTRKFDVDAESAELRLRYRNRKLYAVGHGMAADWEIFENRVTAVMLEPVPAFVVPAVQTTNFAPNTPEADALQLALLSQIDTNPEQVLSSLEAFVGAFSSWVTEQESRVDDFVDESWVATRLVARARASVDRMSEGIRLLGDPGRSTERTAFALGMTAMRLQMRQAAMNRGDTPDSVVEPQWRPFQLGFLLVALASTVDEQHQERELVDLIWFPTGGGKTEAYLALAAIEIFHRRLARGMAGGGTAVITRYTLRLLTSQQFQRAASLVCAMELLRRKGRLEDPRAKGMAPFSIGLWVGNEVTPGTRREAKAALERLHRAARPEEANQFQIESCPWCQTPLVPTSRAIDVSRYGIRLAGNDVVIHCVDSRCEFSGVLPVAVVDEDLYANPPTILLATVDKFARLQFRPEAGRLLGLNTPFVQPSLIIQDELHLLSGPLGTTVAVFDAVIQLLLGRGGVQPKIVASTATIRASDEQVRALYGRSVALYPPAGLDDDRTFFSQPVQSGQGRMYLGLMPQSVSQASAVIAAAAPLLEIPDILESLPATDATRDSYWTAVMYHNSLRELGRTGTLVVDDVNGRLESRSERLGIARRTVRSDRVIELTSRRGPEELPNDLRELARSADSSDEAVDVVLSSNMLSVGIDIPRLALMLMVGQPKTTAEYIQATSRVGRGSNYGIVATLFRSNRARDRSHFETFRSYHEALYRSVEPTSVTPWSLSSRDRSLAGGLVALLRHSIPVLADNDAAGLLDLEDAQMKSTIQGLVVSLMQIIDQSEPIEAGETEASLWELLRAWDHRARNARAAGDALRYDRSKTTEDSLLKRFGEGGEGWLVADSMRSVEPNVAVEVREPMEEVRLGANKA